MGLPQVSPGNLHQPGSSAAEYCQLPAPGFFLARVRKCTGQCSGAGAPPGYAAGKIVLIQLDNEMGMMHWVRNMMDINPDTLARFASYLEKLTTGN